MTNTYSVSRVIEAEACTRQWWAKSVLHMPVRQKGSLTFGTCLHAQIELILNGDQPYPSGWSKDLDHLECELIRELIQSAQKSGMLVPQPEQRIEHAFSFTLPDDLGIFNGKIDLLYLHGIKDHKSVKCRRYMVSKAQLKNNLQLLTYALIYFDAYPDKTTCEIGHDNYVKGYGDAAPSVEPRSVIVEREAVRSILQTRTIPIVRRMAEQRSKTKDSDWFSIPGPHEIGICDKYGGCPFQEICTHQLTPAQYRDRLDPVNQPLPFQPKMVNSRFAALAGRPASPITQAPAPAQAQAPAPAQPAANAPSPVTAPAPAVGALSPGAILVDANAPRAQAAAPWADPDCKNEVCRGRGYTDEGKSCLACSKLYKKRTTKNASDVFNTHYPTDSNRLSWEVDGKLYSVSIVKGARTAQAQAPQPQTPTKTTPTQSVAINSATPAVKALADHIEEKIVESIKLPIVKAPAPSVIANAKAAHKSTTDLDLAKKIADRRLAEEQATPTVKIKIPTGTLTEQLAKAEAEASVRLDQGAVQTRSLAAGTPNGPPASWGILEAPVKEAQELARAKEQMVAEGGPVAPQSEFPIGTLVIGAAITRRPVTGLVLDLELLFKSLCTEVETAMAAVSFYACDTWKRRDLLAGLAVRYVKNGHQLPLAYAPIGNPDLDFMVRAIRPLAETVIEGGAK